MKVEVYSHFLFEKKCKEDNLTDNNVEEMHNCAYIDIIGTRECIKYWIQEDDKHYFQNTKRKDASPSGRRSGTGGTNEPE